MTTALITHSACFGHDPTPGHVEAPERLAAVLEALSTPDFQDLQREEAPAASRDDLLLVHAPEVVDAVLNLIGKLGQQYKYGQIDDSTFVSAGSGEAALRAAGAVVKGVDLVLSGAVKNAFCAVRPPGHHAEPGRPMGFCLFNNVAIGAVHARARHGLNRVAVVDFDVHHGNGTQAAFEDEPGLYYFSSHQSPLYPGTGKASEHGRYENIMNAPLPPGSGSEAFRAVYSNQILPALERVSPDLILISAGFDAHYRDTELRGLEGLNMRLTEDDYAWLTHELTGVASRACRARIVSALEGGYDLTALGLSAAAHVAALIDA